MILLAWTMKGINVSIKKRRLAIGYQQENSVQRNHLPYKLQMRYLQVAMAQYSTSLDFDNVLQALRL